MLLSYLISQVQIRFDLYLLGVLACVNVDPEVNIRTEPVSRSLMSRFENTNVFNTSIIAALALTI